MGLVHLIRGGVANGKVGPSWKPSDLYDSGGPACTAKILRGTKRYIFGQYPTISDKFGNPMFSADFGRYRQPLGTSVIRDWKVSRVNPGKALPDETQIELRAEMERFMNGRNRSDRWGERDRGHLEETSAEESTRRGKQIVNRILTAKSSKLGGEL